MSNNTEFPPKNRILLNIYKIIKAVMSSSSEAELGVLFINCKDSIPARKYLEEMGHKQQPTPMQTYNTTTQGLVTKNISGKILK